MLLLGELEIMKAGGNKFFELKIVVFNSACMFVNELHNWVWQLTENEVSWKEPVYTIRNP